MSSYRTAAALFVPNVAASGCVKWHSSYKSRQFDDENGWASPWKQTCSVHCRKARVSMRTSTIALDPTRRSAEATKFETALRHKVVGQDHAIQSLVEIYQMFLAGLNPPGRPIGNLLFLGPTGSGKTRMVEAMAESLFGDSRAFLKIDCAEFQHS